MDGFIANNKTIFTLGHIKYFILFKMNMQWRTGFFAPGIFKYRQLVAGVLTGNFDVLGVYFPEGEYFIKPAFSRFYFERVGGSCAVGFWQFWKSDGRCKSKSCQ